MRLFPFLLFCLSTIACPAQPAAYLLQPDRVFDGERLHEDWWVFVEGNRIRAVGPASSMQRPEGLQVIELPGHTLMPGLIEGHSHLLLYPYNQTPWNDQVLKESESYRVAVATQHAAATLQAGVTTVRDLGSEGAGYADVGLKKAIADGRIPGPRMIVTTRAIVASGSYGPKGFSTEHQLPVGAEEADGIDGIILTVRRQIGKGADWIKVYADYRWGPNGEAMPTFLQEELDLLVRTAASSGRKVVAHAATPEGMRRATLAGVATIEHGDGGTREVFQLMQERGVALCPTLTAAEATAQYRGWKKGTEPEPARIQQKKKSFQLALEMGVPICFGGDVGVYEHGDNVRELELMVAYGMPLSDALKAATSGNADLFDLDELGRIQPGKLADLIAVEGNPVDDLAALREVNFVMKDGKVYRHRD